VLILAKYALSMIKTDHEPLHTLIGAFEFFWTKEEAEIFAKCCSAKERGNV